MIVKKLRSIFKYILVNPSNKGEYHRRIFYALGWQLWKRVFGIPLVLTLDNGRSYIAFPRSGNSTGAIYTRIYEPEYVLFLRKHAVTGGGDYRVLIDVGAHTGLFSLWMSDLVESGYLFEPARDTFQILKKNIAINQLSLFVSPLAISWKSGVEIFTLNGNFSGTNHLGAASYKENSSCLVSEYVNVSTLDAECADVVIGILKIDTEGNELNVLRGGVKLLTRSHEAICLVENSDPRGICEFFDELGYYTFAINQRGGILTDDLAKRNAYNLLACGPNHPLAKLLS